MEIFDILDAQGNPTGKTAPRGYTCLENEYYLGVHVYIYNSDNMFLLQKRASNKKFLPDAWETLLEHAIASESGIDAARRGVYEELGLVFDKSLFQFLTRMIWSKDHHIVDIFFLKADIDIQAVTFQAEEVTALKWIAKEKMLEFIANMSSYRPKEYREIVAAHVEGLCP